MFDGCPDEIDEKRMRILHARPVFGVKLDAHEPRMREDPEFEEQLIRDVRYIPLEELPHLTVFPEKLPEQLLGDMRNGLPKITQYLGTLR